MVLIYASVGFGDFLSSKVRGSGTPSTTRIPCQASFPREGVRFGWNLPRATTSSKWNRSEDNLSRWALVAAHEPVMDLFSDLDEDLTPRYSLNDAHKVLVGADIQKDPLGGVRSRTGGLRSILLLNRLSLEGEYEVMNVDVPTVSGVHALLTRDEEHERYLLRDLDSTNGTFLNRARLRANVDVKLKVGDVIAFGDLGTAWKVEVLR